MRAALYENLSAKGNSQLKAVARSASVHLVSGIEVTYLRGAVLLFSVCFPT